MAVGIYSYTFKSVIFKSVILESVKIKIFAKSIKMVSKVNVLHEAVLNKSKTHHAGAPQSHQVW